MRKSKAARPNVVKSAVRVLEILEYFDEVRGPASIVSIARALSYPQSSAAALLRSMVALGYLQYDSRERTYLPTDRVPLLGNWINPALFRDGRILRLMEQLNRQTGATAVLAARNGDYAQYIHVVDAGNPKNVLAKLGQLCPIALSATGQALLSHYSDEDVRRLLHRLNAQVATSAGAIRFRELAHKLGEARQKGYALSLDGVVVGLGMMAAVLPETESHRLLVLGLGLPSDELKMREHELSQSLLKEIGAHVGARVIAGSDVTVSDMAAARAAREQAPRLLPNVTLPYGVRRAATG